jgi:L-rhamnose mutarotase
MDSIAKTILIAIPLVFWAVSCMPPMGNHDESSAEKQVTSDKQIKRYGSVIKVNPEMLDQYKALHANPWPGILEQISQCNIRNYSIYLKDDYLFGYFEYTGDDFAGDMAKMAQDSLTREWWKLTDPCQVPLDTREEGEWWANMEEVFHHD